MAEVNGRLLDDLVAATLEDLTEMSACIPKGSEPMVIPYHGIADECDCEDQLRVMIAKQSRTDFSYYLRDRFRRIIAEWRS